MNLVQSLAGVIVLAVLIVIGWKVSQIVAELNSPATQQTTTAGLTIPPQLSSIEIRWSHFPITVYINDDSIRQNPNYADDVKQALNIWQSTGIVSFAVVDNPNAEITIKWVNKLKEKSLDTLGNTDLKFINTTQFGVIQNATIELLTKSDSRELSSTDMINLALHEIGHAIGLQHTEEDDIMNPVLIVPSKSIKPVSSNNINDLMELYKIPARPDIKINGVNATKFSFSRLGQDYFYLNISIDLQNIGLVDIENFKIQLGADNFVINEGTQSKLEAGNILNIFHGNLRVDRNFTSVQVSIDPENIIDELNETNNFVDIPV